MKKTTAGFIAGAAGAALLLSGSTFALWSDSGEAPGGTLTAGNLDVGVISTTWQDISADRLDNPHDIDLSTFRIIPGDVIQASVKIDLGLEGENMVATLGLAADGTAITGQLASGVSLACSVLDGAGGVLVGPSACDTYSINLASTDNGNNVMPTLGTVPLAVDGAEEFTVLVTATFDPMTADQALVQTTALLSNMDVTLTQTRAVGAGGGF